MSSIITVTDAHKMPVPLVYNLGNTTLVITADYGSPDAFELAAPNLAAEDTAESQTVILDHDETYNLYQCLHTLFHPPTSE